VFGYVLDPTIVQAFSGCGDCIFYKLQTLKTAQDFGAKPFKFRPLDKDDAVPRVRKAVRGRCDGGLSRYNVQRPDEPDQTGGHEGPTIHFDRPRAGTPAPRLIRFPVGPECAVAIPLLAQTNRALPQLALS
jgi:hypothetical protein